MVSVVILFATEAIFHWSLRGKVVDAPVGMHAGVILEKPKQNGKVWSAPVMMAEGHRIMLTAVGSLPIRNHREDTCVIGQGVVMFYSAIEPPRNTHNPGEMEYGTWLIRHGYEGTAFCYKNQWKYEENGFLPLSGWDNLRVKFLQWREHLLGVFAEKFTGDEFSILAAMTLGEKSYIDKTLKDDFSTVGASHILALSGLHLGILVSIYMLLCHKVIRRSKFARVVAAVGGVFLLLAFLMITGMPTSLVRSALMLGTAMICTLLERRGLSLNNLCLAACVILIADPCSLFDVGFQLSFVSVAAILVATRAFPFPKRWVRIISNKVIMEEEARYQVARRRLLSQPIGAGSVDIIDYIPKRLPFWEWFKIKVITIGGRVGWLLWDMTVVSLAAQIGSLPLVIYYFHSIPIYGFMLSFLLIPLAYLILGGAILYFALPFARSFSAVVLRYFVATLVAVVQWASALPGNHISVDWHTKPPLVIYSRFSTPEIYYAEGEWKDNVLFTPYGCLVKIDNRLPKGRPGAPLQIDVLWICRGAKGDLAEWLELYRPKVVVLDGSLTKFYYNFYRTQAQQIKIPLHDIRREGAYVVDE